MRLLGRHGPDHGPLGRQRGFGLLGLTGAVFVVSLVLAGWYHREIGEHEQAKIDGTRDIIIATAEVLYKYRLENANTWPSSMSDLSALAPVLAANARNGAGQPLTLVAPSPPNHPTAPIVIRTDLLDADLADTVGSEFPGQVLGKPLSITPPTISASPSLTDVEIVIPIPGHEPGTRIQELLVRDGARDMTGDLDMGGHDINDVDSFLINERLIIGGEVLDRDGARFLVEMAGLNCGPDQLLAISGGTPSCINFNPAGAVPPPPPPPPTPTLPGVSVSGGIAVTEGTDAVFTLTSTAPFSSAVTVVLDVSDDSSSDFLASADEGTKSVIFPAGSSSVIWSVPTEDDSTAEPNGQVTARVRNGSGYVPYAPESATVDVNDNDGGPPLGPVITVSGGSGVTEGVSAIFTLRSDRVSSAAIDISVTVSDDATSDFLAASREGRKTVRLPAGARTVTYSVRTEDDGTDEPDGRVTVTIRGSSGYTAGSPSSASVAVLDNDAALVNAPVITITGGSAITEGGTARFTVTADRASTAAINISLDVSDDATSDFLAPSAEGRKSVTLPAGARSATYSVRTEDDSADEPNGQVSARIVGGTGYTPGSASSASVTVRDNDLPPLGIPEISISPGGPVTEGGDAIFTIRASRGSAAAISIDLNVADDASADFLAASDEGRKTVTLPARHSHVRYTAPTEDDTVDEPDGRVTARIVTGTGYTIGSRSSASVTVRDDDAAPPAIPVITITGGSPVTEGGTAVFTIQADRVPAANISIGLDVSDDATSDFLAPSSEGRKSVSLARGSRVATHSVRTVNDTVDEPDGQITARIVNGAGYTIGSPSSGSVDVNDDDVDICPRPDDLDPRAGWNASTCTAFCGAETWDYSMGIRVSVGVTQRRGLDYATYSHTQPGDCSDSSVYNINELLFFAGSGSSCGIWSIYEVVGPNGANFYGRNIQQPQQYTLPHLNPLILTCGPRLCFSLSSEIISRCGARR